MGVARHQMRCSIRVTRAGGVAQVAESTCHRLEADFPRQQPVFSGCDARLSLFSLI
jgi:hypothetical protein